MRPSKKFFVTATTIENLEARRLLAATLLSQIPGDTLNAGSGAAAPITLSTFFNDPSIVAGDTLVDIQTNMPAPDDNIVLMLTNSATPLTVANFLKYVNNGEYDNTIIHRSIPGFIIQGGGDDTDGSQITSLGTVLGESSTATLKNTTGTIAMALTGTPQAPAPNSGTDEWFINLANNSDLDDASDGGPFTAFGSVIYGMATMNDIAALQTVNASGVSPEWSNLPLQSVPSGPPIPTNDFVITNPSVVTTPLSYSAVSSNPSAVAASVTNGNLILTPGSSAGSANITVTATDLGGGTAVSTFAVTVNAPANPPPTANADSASTPENTAVTINVLANDTPTNQINASSVQISITPTDGTASVNSNGTITYIPATNFTGEDSFSYTVANTQGTRSSAATVSITVTAPTNSAPTANADSAQTTTNTAVTIDVLANDTPTDQINPSTVLISTTPTDGTATVNSDGTITYTPANNFTGDDTFSYTVANTDGARSSPAAVSITVVAPPFAAAYTAETIGNTPVVIDVLANDTASAGINPASVLVTTNPQNGTAVVNSDGTITYTPTSSDFVGGDSFTYTFADSDGNVSNTNAVDVNVGVTIAGPGQKLPQSLTYTDLDGTTGIITLKGPGSATVYFPGTGSASASGKTGIIITGANQQIANLVTSGTTSATTLSITTKGGNRIVTVNGLSTGSLKSLSVEGIDLLGNITATGSISDMTLLQGIADLTSGLPPTISAASIGNLTITGPYPFINSLTLTAPGVDLTNFSAPSVTFGTWTLAGSAKNISVTKNGFAATVTAASIGTMRVNGHLVGTLNLTAPGTDLTTLSVTGAINASSITAAGNIGAITAASMIDSQIYAGVANLSTGQTLPNSAADFVSVDSIKSVTLKTIAGADSFYNSAIAAATLGNLTLATIQTDNSGNPTGVAAQTITTLTATANKKFTLKKLTSATNISALLAKAGADIGPDFQIDLISP